MPDTTIRLLPDDYRLKRDEIKTKDDQKVGFIRGKYHIDVRAFYSEEDSAVYWVVCNDTAWKEGCEWIVNHPQEWKELMEHSKEVAVVKKRAREIRNARS